MSNIFAHHVETDYGTAEEVAQEIEAHRQDFASEENPPGAFSTIYWIVLVLIIATIGIIVYHSIHHRKRSTS